MNDWKTVQLGECTQWYSGGTPSKSNPDYWNGTIPWVSAKDMKTFRLYDAEDHVSADGARNGTRLIPPGAILILIRGMTLHNDVPVCVAMREMAFNQDVKAVVAKPSIDASFLSYWFVANKPLLLATVDSASHGTGRIYPDELKKKEIRLPSLPEQRAIAEVLGAFDDKIDLNRRMNQTLEEMAQAFFKSWFVDFDPVRAKMEGRKPEGMDAETAALFPSEFAESETGSIPTGWRIDQLGSGIEINKRSIGKGYPHREIRYVDIGSVSRGRRDETSIVDIADAPSRAKRLVRQGDTIWSTVRPNREAYLFIDAPEDNLVVSTGFAVLTPRSLPPAYGYFLTTTHDFVTYLSYSADGGAYPAVLPSRFAEARVLFPPDSILSAFEKAAKPLLARIHANERQNRTLAEIRDSLLPKLISGEIRVPLTEGVGNG